jgi:hypothetical protein
MFVPLLTRKGGTAHRRAGWVFVSGMAVVSATALVLAAARALTDPRPEARAFSAFLFYVAILTAAGLSEGLRALRTRRRTGPSRSAWDLGISSLLVGAAAAMTLWGLAAGRPLFAAFGVVGIVSGTSQLAYWLRPPAHRMHWWFAHMGGMIGSCIAATTAFLVLNANRFGPAPPSWIVWLGPTLVGVPLMAALTAHYTRTFATGREARRGTSPPAPAAGPCRPSHIS